MKSLWLSLDMNVTLVFTCLCMYQVYFPLSYLFYSSIGPALFSLKFMVTFFHRETAPSRSGGETQGLSSPRFYISRQDSILEGGK